MIQNKAITNNYDVSTLKDNDKIIFHLDKNAQFSNTHVHEEVVQLSFEEYRKQHWVNEEAGFYALVGKMTKDEENRALLEIYSAFVEKEEEKQRNTKDSQGK
eukprot:Phypoly_transcript_22796.p1 GENE.Phypoly_transcript_22796~~Phypoly_transcript_22796.p1  ORF type:complete len:102 (+),score=29.62 Phypoly_transcript_22796:65-370(+)